MRLFLGIDGGQSTTTAVIGDDSGRILGSGVRLYAAAIALVIVVDIPFPVAIALIGVVAVAYTVSGGIRSVIWTDMLQALLFVGGGMLALGFLVAEAGGVSTLYSALSQGTTPGGNPSGM